MGSADPFLLGTAGRMIPMPSPVADGFDAPYGRTSAEHRSLTGATTVDVLGAHRSWAFEFSYRHRGESARLIARWTSPITSAPLRLIDPITPNRLSLDAASGGGTSGTADAAEADTGEVRRVLRGDEMPDEVAGLLDGAYRWEFGSGSGELLLDPADRVPVVVDEDLEFRVWARGNTSVRPFTRYYLDDGTDIDGTGAEVVLDPDDWTVLTNTGQIVEGEALASPGVKAGSGGSDRWVELAAPLVTLDPDDDGEWTPGGGGPVVVLVGFEHGYQRFGRREMTLTVREA